MPNHQKKPFIIYCLELVVVPTDSEPHGMEWNFILIYIINPKQLNFLLKFYVSETDFHTQTLVTGGITQRRRSLNDVRGAQTIQQPPPLADDKLSVKETKQQKQTQLETNTISYAMFIFNDTPSWLLILGKRSRNMSRQKRHK
jgi:hypothetical protein